MRAVLFTAGMAAVIAAAVACATTGDLDTESPDVEGGPTVSPEDASADRASIEEGVETTSPCSQAGWCVTELPDKDLVVKDIWPVEGYAFAVAESPSVGVKVLEWSDATARWRYIDDNTQNESGLASYVGRVWAPSADEVYYGVAPGTIYHGKRVPPPSASWTWSSQKLVDNSGYQPSNANDTYDNGRPPNPALGYLYPALGVWGTNKNHVFAWYSNSIYRLTVDRDGTPVWVAEYVADDVASSESLFVLGAAGTGPDNVWFTGARSRSAGTSYVACVFIVQKTTAGYQRVADGVFASASSSSCTDRAGFPLLTDAGGWLTDIHSPAAGRLVGVKDGRHVVKVTALDDGGYSVLTSHPPASLTGTLVNSMWMPPTSEQVWLSGTGILLHGSDVWGNGDYRISTIAMNGAPVPKQFYQIRGLSNTNLWAVGEGYALHKTTP